MNLELKRTELLTKYQPTYALVQEVDKEIADARASIVSEESRPIRAGNHRPEPNLRLDQ